MAVFSTSLFQSVLDRLEEDQPPPADEPAAGLAVRGLKAGFVAEAWAETWAETGVEPLADARLGDAYADFAPEAAAEPEPAPPAWLDRLSEAEVAADLGLAEGDDAATIQDKRRAFARANHPDLAGPAFSVQATIRMMTANMLCDQAIRNRV